MEKETYVASDAMKKFFENLLELKQFVKEKSEETDNKIIKEIYNKLDKIIKNEDKKS